MRELSVRTDLRPGDIGSVVRFHGVVYADEYGFDPTFEAYVARPLADFVLNRSPRERLWIAEHDDALVGCIAIVAQSSEVAQLRWYLVAAESRGQGLGRRLLDEAIDFCKANRYNRVMLWTVSALVDAARLYQQAGFRLVEELPGMRWGVEVVEQRYELEFGAASDHRTV